jgi:hypothetical protein
MQSVGQDVVSARANDRPRRGRARTEQKMLPISHEAFQGLDQLCGVAAEAVFEDDFHFVV